MTNRDLGICIVAALIVGYLACVLICNIYHRKNLVDAGYAVNGWNPCASCWALTDLIKGEE